jgi:hypothetical protein
MTFETSSICIKIWALKLASNGTYLKNQSIIQIIVLPLWFLKITKLQL